MQNIKLWEPILAYAFFGWFLGTLTPGLCALLIIFDLTWSREQDQRTATFLLIVILICSVVGFLAGSGVGWLMKFLRARTNLLVLVLASPVLGLLWGIVTGGAGGLPVMIVGALFGAAIAGFVGAFGFTVFAAIYEPLARRFELGRWQSPLIALGISLFISLAVAAAFYLNSK